jgi:hypothetical protein
MVVLSQTAHTCRALPRSWMDLAALQKRDRLGCRGSGALVPPKADERFLWDVARSDEQIVVLSDVARGLSYLQSEVHVIHRDVKSANMLLEKG